MNTLKMLWLLARRTAKEYSADNCSHMAAAISYYILFSIVPLMIFAVSVLGFVVRDADRQQDLAREVVEFLNLEAGNVILEPDEDAVRERYGNEGLNEITALLVGGSLSQDDLRGFAETLDEGGTIELAGRPLGSDDVSIRNDNLVTDTISGVSDVSGALTIVGLVGVAWSASAMFGALRKSLNIAWDVEVHRPVVQQKALDLAMVFGLGLLLLLSIGGTAALRVLRELSEDNLGPLSTGSGFLWSVFPLFLPAVFSFLVFLFVYRYVPNATTSFRSVWPGAVLAAVLFEVLKNLFALYIAKFSNYNAAYGALGGVLLFMLWAYLTSNILLIGAELAAEYPRVRRGDYDAVDEPARPDDASWSGKAWRFVKGLFVQDPDERRTADER